MTEPATERLRRNSNVQVLTLLVDTDDKEDSEYRFLVDGRHVKYVTVAAGSLPKDKRTFGPVLIPLLPPFPAGDWNEGHIEQDHDTNELYFSHYEKVEFEGIEVTWHPRHIDFLEMTRLERLRQNVLRMSHPDFDTPVIFKFAEFPWQIPYFEAETMAYEWIDGTDIGPRFYAHVTEAGRVIGWIMEDLHEMRTAEPEDLAVCQVALTELHALGIKHGDINRFNFMVKGNVARMIDFETAQKCEDSKELQDELERLAESLNDPSFRGGIGPAERAESPTRRK